MAIRKNDKYADFKYVLSSTELKEAKWLIEQGDFKDLDDFIESSRNAEIRMMKREDAEKKRKANLTKLKPTEPKKKQRAA